MADAKLVEFLKANKVEPLIVMCDHCKGLGATLDNVTEGFAEINHKVASKVGNILNQMGYGMIRTLVSDPSTPDVSWYEIIKLLGEPVD